MKIPSSNILDFLCVQETKLKIKTGSTKRIYFSSQFKRNSKKYEILFIRELMFDSVLSTGAVLLMTCNVQIVLHH